MQVKEDSEKAGLKLNIQKTKIVASGPITSWQIEEIITGNISNFRISKKMLPMHIIGNAFIYKCNNIVIEVNHLSCCLWAGR